MDLSSNLRTIAFGRGTPLSDEDPELFTVMAGISRSDVEKCLATLEHDHESDGPLLRHSEDRYAWIDGETVLVGSGASVGQGGMDKEEAGRLLNANQQVIRNDKMRSAMEALDRRAAARYLSFKRGDSQK